jgi:hypothetical protein
LPRICGNKKIKVENEGPTGLETGWPLFFVEPERHVTYSREGSSLYGLYGDREKPRTGTCRGMVVLFSAAVGGQR